ncbi:MAG: M20/M25/M40 family metallo-hydrolase [candidate division Zixibacteria bacterium]|nr:M20/M25/M40 family metallo-hydrolase [candidate division Zixibacteria bacterium]
MKKLLVFLGLCCSVFYVSAWAQPDYLIKIDGINQATMDQIKNTEIEVYAKTADFWVGGAGKEDLEFLTKQRVIFQILDQEADMGEYYLVWTKPSGAIRSQLQKVKDRSRLLFTDEDVAVVGGNPKKIEELASLGFRLRKIHKRPLPLEPKTYIPSYLESLSPEYDPLIDSIVNKVNPAQLLSWVDELTGEDIVLIGGVEDSIKTRYSWSDGVFKAAYYLKERFEEMDLSAEFDTFQVGAPTAYLFDIACGPDGQKAWSVSLGGGIIKTTDGGNYWSLVEGTDSLTLWDICRVDDDTMWSVGKRGIIIRSTDGGDTWESKSKPEFSGLDFRGSYFEDAGCGWVVGDEKVLFTSDGGANWIEQAQVVGVNLYSIDFADTSRGWIVGENGTILHTTDRGTNWNPQTSSTSTRLRSVDFVDLLNGWAVGEDGWAIYTTNGGLNWNRKTLPTSNDLNCVDFVDSLHGWMVGLDGSIFYTSDLGVNWASQPSGSYYLFGVNFADTLTGWATGLDDIIKTTNGGQSWFSQYDHLEYPHLLNVVGTIDGWCYPGRQFLITGHYDDISEDPYNWAPGADDNASSVVSLLSAASILKDYALANTVKFVAFSGEEQGLLGSAAYAEEAYNRGDTILGVINCDMIAYDGNGDGVMEVHSGLPEENQALADIFIGAISDYGLNLVPQKITEGASHSSDHASFWSYGFPAILGHEDYQDWNPHMHTTQDRVSTFDSTYYLEFVKAALASIAILGDPFIFGDASGDGLIDLGDVVYLVNYLYKTGPAPEPLQAGDANCDIVVDLGDVIYLINYLFKGGLPPSC